MDLLTLIILFVASVILVKIFSRQEKSVPSPTGFPILGYIPLLRSNSLETLQKLAAKYGPVLKVNILNEDYYFLNSIETVKEAFLDQADNFAGKPVSEFNLISMLVTEKTVGTSEGEWWSIHHKFVVRKLVNLGMGKSAYESKMNELCEQMVNFVRRKNGNEFDCLEMLMNYTTNVISNLVYSKVYAIDDADYIPLRDIVQDMFAGENSIVVLLGGRLLQLLLYCNRKEYRKVKRFKQTFYNYMRNIYEQRVNSDVKAEFEDLLNSYIEEANGPNSKYFDEETIISNIIGLFAAGTLSSSITLYRLLLLMALNPNIQKDVFEEIEHSIGSETMVLMNDKNILHLTQAAISEVHRYCGIDVSQIHVNQEATVIGGYCIPKRSKVFANLRCLARDRRYFEKPDQFFPHHFLDENGHFVNKEANIPFSIGKRRCLGEKLAEFEVFIAFVTLIQRFEWKIGESNANAVNVFSLSNRFKLTALNRI